MVETAGFTQIPTYAQFMEAANHAEDAHDYVAASQLRDAAEKYAQTTKQAPAERGYIPQLQAGLAGGFGSALDAASAAGNSIVPVGDLANFISGKLGHGPVLPTIGTMTSGQTPMISGAPALTSGLNALDQAVMPDTRVATGGPTNIWEAMGRGTGYGASLIAPMGLAGKGLTAAGDALKAGSAATRTGLLDDALSTFAQQTADHVASPVGQAVEDTATTLAKRTATVARHTDDLNTAKQALIDATTAGDQTAIAAANASAKTSASRLATATARQTEAQIAHDTAAATASASAPTMGEVANPLAARIADRTGGILKGIGAVGEGVTSPAGAIGWMAGNTESGGLSELGKERGLGPTGQAIVGSLGGLEFPLASTLLKGGVKLATSKAARAAAQDALGTSEKAAVNAVDGGVASRFAAGAENSGNSMAAMVDQGQVPGNNPVGLTPAELTRNPTVMGMEASARQPHADAIAAHEARMASLPDKVVSLLPGETTALRPGQDVVRQQLIDEETALNAKHAASVAQRQSLLDNIVPSTDSMASSAAGASALQQAQENSRSAMKGLWAKVNGSLGAAVPASRTAATGIINDMAKGIGPKDTNDVLDRFLQMRSLAPKALPKVQVLNDMYSELRTASNSIDWTDRAQRMLKARLNTAADAINADIAAIPNRGEGAKVFAARSATVDHYNSFGNNSTPASVLNKVGTPGNPAETAFTDAIKPLGDPGTVAVNQVLQAASKGNMQPEVSSALVDNLKAQFAKSARNADGSISVNKAQTWMNNHGAKLDSIDPTQALRGTFNDAIQAQRDNLSSLASTKNAINILKKTSPAAKFVNASTPRSVVTSMLTDPVPEDAADQLVALISKVPKAADKQTAREGVRNAIRQHIVDMSKAPGSSKISGNGLLATLDNGNMPKILPKFFSQAEIDTMHKLGEDLGTAQLTPRNVSHIMNPPKPQLMDSAMSILGSKAKIPFVGNSLAAKTAQIKGLKSIFTPDRNPAINEAVHQTFQDPVKTAAALRASAAQPSPSLGGLNLGGVRSGISNAIGSLRAAPAQDVVSMLNPLLSTIMGSTSNSVRNFNNQPPQQ